MEKIRVAFEYFPREASKEDNFFPNFINKHFNAEVSGNPDFVFFSSFTKEGTKIIPNIKEDVTKIFWTGENIRTDMKKCDYAFGFEYEEEIKSENYMRLPLYAYYGAGKDLTRAKNPREILKSKTKFCNYTYSKDSKERVEFFKELSKYKRVDAPGKSMNNTTTVPSDKHKIMLNTVQLVEKAVTKKHSLSALLQRHFGDWRKDVIAFQKDYKFTIAFENSSRAGYTTEKIYHPMLANSIPIYWGNPEIGRDFNTKSFINWHEYNDHKKVVDRVIELDNDENKYIKMLKEPWFKNNEPNGWCDKERILKQFEKIFGVKRER